MWCNQMPELPKTTKDELGVVAYPGDPKGQWARAALYFSARQPDKDRAVDVDQLPRQRPRGRQGPGHRPRPAAEPRHPHRRAEHADRRRHEDLRRLRERRSATKFGPAPQVPPKGHSTLRSELTRHAERCRPAGPPPRGRRGLHHGREDRNREAEATSSGADHRAGTPCPDRRRGRRVEGAGPPAAKGLAGYVFLSPWLLGLLAITAIPMLCRWSSASPTTTSSPTGRSCNWVGLRQLPAHVHRGPDVLALGAGHRRCTRHRDAAEAAAALGVALLLNKATAARASTAACSTCRRCSAAASPWPSSGGRCSAATASSTRSWRSSASTARGWVNDPDCALYTLVAAGGLAVRRADGHLPGRPQAGAVELYEAARWTAPGRAQVLAHHAADAVAGHLLQPGAGDHPRVPGLHARRSSSAAGSGGPADSTLIYTLYLYQKGFTDSQMGYASAMAWVLLLAIGAGHRRAVLAPDGSGCTTRTARQTDDHVEPRRSRPSLGGT